MERYIGQAAVVAPPTSITATAVTGTSTSAVALSIVDGWVTMTSIGTTSYVIFGTSAVGAATTSHYPIPDGAERHFYVNSRVTHFRVIGAGTGTLHWYSSSDQL